MIHGMEQRSATDFNQIPFIQAVFEHLPEHPTEGSGDSGPIAFGRFYYNTTDNTPYIYTPFGWIPLVSDGPRKKTFSIGNNSDTYFPCVHNLGSRNVMVSVRLTEAPYDLVAIDVAFTDDNTVTIHSMYPLLEDELTVIIVG